MAILNLNASPKNEFCISIHRQHESGDLKLDGNLIVGFKPDGAMVLGDSVASDDAAIAFFRVVQRLYRGFMAGEFREDYADVNGHLTAKGWLERVVEQVPAKAKMREFL
jgi:hypothetical protein